MWVCPIGASQTLFPASDNSASSQARRSIPSLCAASPTATSAVTCAVDWTHFPFPDMARRIWQEYFVPGGKAPDAPYPTAPMHQKVEPRKLIELCMVSNFVEVFLAREGHANKVGVNFLEKVQLPHLASLYGAMLAGVGYVLMGAGIPLHIPGVLDNYAAMQSAEYKLAVTGATADQDTDDALRSRRLH